MRSIISTRRFVASLHGKRLHEDLRNGRAVGMDRAPIPLAKRAVTEAIGTGVLLAAIVGSGIMAQRLAGGNVAMALLANSLATGGVLVCLIGALGPISGAHFNPAVSVADAVRGGMPWREVPLYVWAQICGGLAGVASANAMFGLPVLFVSHRVRTGGAMLFAEFLATFGLLLVVLGCVRFRPSITPFTVAGYIVGAYWFTSSTSFANPAVTIARCLSDTFAGIRPIDAPGFILAEFAGATCATALFAWIVPAPPDARPALLQHDGEASTRVAS